MKVLFDKDIDLNWNKGNTSEEITFQQKVLGYLNKIDYYQTLLNKDVDDLTFYEALNKVSNIILEKKDYLEILSIIHNNSYQDFIEITTKMVGRFYSEKEKYISYIGAYSLGVKIDPLYFYSKEEIKKLLKEKKLLLVEEIKNDFAILENDSQFLLNQKEEYEELPLFNLATLNTENKDVLSYIRSNVDIEEIRKSFNEYSENLKLKINNELNKGIVSNTNLERSYAKESIRIIKDKGYSRILSI